MTEKATPTPAPTAAAPDPGAELAELHERVTTLEGQIGTILNCLAAAGFHPDTLAAAAAPATDATS